MLADRASLALADLFEATQRRVRLGVLDGTGVSYIEQRTRGEPPAGFTTGANLPAHATALGKALLAFAPAQTIQGLPPISGGTRPGRSRGWTGCATSCGSSG